MTRTTASPTRSCSSAGSRSRRQGRGEAKKGARHRRPQLQGRHRVRRHRRGGRRLLPVRHRSEDHPVAAEVGHAADPRSDHRGRQGQHLQRRRPTPSIRCWACGSRTPPASRSRRGRSPSTTTAPTPATRASSTCSPTRNACSATPSTRAPRSRRDVKSTPSPEMNFRLGEPNLTARYKLRQTKTYTIKNRSTHDRTVILEHPIRSDWKLVDQKPSEKTRSHYRFTVEVAAGKTVTFDVVEEQAARRSAWPSPARRRRSTPRPGHPGQADWRTCRRRSCRRLKIQKGFVMPTLKVARIEDLPRAEPVRAGPQLHRRSRHSQGLERASTRRRTRKPGPDVFRFKLEVAKGKTGSQEIIEERIHTEKGKLLKDVSETKLREYLAHAVPSAEVKAALTKRPGPASQAGRDAQQATRRAGEEPQGRQRRPGPAAREPEDHPADVRSLQEVPGQVRRPGDRDRKPAQRDSPRRRSTPARRRRRTSGSSRG